MKKLLLSLTLALAALNTFTTAKASTVVGYLLDPTLQSNTVPITFKNTGEAIHGTNIIYTSAKTITATNGAFSVVLGPGNYQVQIGPRNDAGTFSLPDDNNTYNLASLLGAGITYTFPYSPVYLAKTGDTMIGNLGFGATNQAGLILNNLTTAQRTALTGTNGMLVYDTTLQAAMLYQSGAWISTGGAPNATNLVGVVPNANLPANLVTTNGAGQFVYKRVSFLDGIGYGDTSQMPSDANNAVNWYFAGNPNEAVPANVGADYGVQFQSMNPYARVTVSLGYSTTNTNHWVGGALLTNSINDKIGGYVNAFSMVMENEQGVLNNMPGVGNMVNNGGNISISVSAQRGGIFGDYPWVYTDPVSGKWGTPFWDVGVFTNVNNNAVKGQNTINWAFSIDPVTGNTAIGGTAVVSNNLTLGGRITAVNTNGYASFAANRGSPIITLNSTAFEGDFELGLSGAQTGITGINHELLWRDSSGNVTWSCSGPNGNGYNRFMLWNVPLVWLQDGQADIGTAGGGNGGGRPGTAYVKNAVVIATSKISSGTGSPNGVVTGSIGDQYYRSDGGAATTLYVKESGSATTSGWVGK